MPGGPIGWRNDFTFAMDLLLLSFFAAFFFIVAPPVVPEFESAIRPAKLLGVEWTHHLGRSETLAAASTARMIS
jgi:hypothetical protein